MGHGPCTFKEADVKRALKAARDMGFNVAGYTVDAQGKIEVRFGKPGESNDEANAWDEVLTDASHQKRPS